MYATYESECSVGGVKEDGEENTKERRLGRAGRKRMQGRKKKALLTLSWEERKKATVESNVSP